MFSVSRLQSVRSLLLARVCLLCCACSLLSLAVILCRGLPTHTHHNTESSLLAMLHALLHTYLPAGGSTKKRKGVTACMDGWMDGWDQNVVGVGCLHACSCLCPCTCVPAAAVRVFFLAASAKVRKLRKPHALRITATHTPKCPCTDLHTYIHMQCLLTVLAIFVNTSVCQHLQQQQQQWGSLCGSSCMHMQRTGLGTWICAGEYRQSILHAVAMPPQCVVAF